MGIKNIHLREVIMKVTGELGRYAHEPRLCTPASTELLMMTSAQESRLGKYLKQDDNNPKTLHDGPALGIFQMEPATMEDLFENYLIYNDDMLDAQIMFAKCVNKENWVIHMMADIPYQIVMARLQYWRQPDALPHAGDIRGLAMYYKKFWNTPLGAATVEETIINYGRYC